MAVRTDGELVAAARGGSQEACRELIERYERPVFSLVVRMVRDPATAEDLAQDVFLKMYRHLAAYDPARKFSSWLFKIAHNATIDHLRRRSNEAVSLDAPGDEEPGAWRAEIADPAGESPEAALRRGELGEALERAVAGLRPAVREVVLLRFREDLAYEEIAEVTGLPLGTVKTFIFRGRKEMARVLSLEGWGPAAAGRPETSPSGDA
jgi:RNA polymerase sigma-70 factor (ECF subfamily)